MGPTRTHPLRDKPHLSFTVIAPVPSCVSLRPNNVELSVGQTLFSCLALRNSSLCLYLACSSFSHSKANARAIRPTQTDTIAAGVLRLKLWKRRSEMGPRHQNASRIAAASQW